MAKLWILLFFVALSRVNGFLEETYDEWTGKSYDDYLAALDYDYPGPENEEFVSSDETKEKAELNEDYQIEDNRSALEENEALRDLGDHDLDSIKPAIDFQGQFDELLKLSEENPLELINLKDVENDSSENVQQENDKNSEEKKWDVGKAFSLNFNPLGRIDETGKAVVEENGNEETGIVSDDNDLRDIFVKANSQIKEDVAENADSVESEIDETLKNMNDDIKTLLDTLDKLSDDDSEEINADDSFNPLDYAESDINDLASDYENNLSKQLLDEDEEISETFDESDQSSQVINSSNNKEDSKNELEDDMISEESDVDQNEQESNDKIEMYLNEENESQYSFKNSEETVGESIINDNDSNEHNDDSAIAIDTFNLDFDKINDDQEEINKEENTAVDEAIENPESQQDNNDENADVLLELEASDNESEPIKDDNDKEETDMKENAEVDIDNKNVVPDAEPDVNDENNDKLLENDDKAISPDQEDTKEINDVDDNMTVNSDENSELSEQKVDTEPSDDQIIESSSYDEVMATFVKDHKDELNVNSENFVKANAPVYLTLSVGEPLEVTSPDWPSPYPTDNVIDWILEGDGMGIELNLTDFFVNGFNGDYLLIKPGGTDESGRDGLVFSYNLATERRYRFLDVNRIFVRFNAGPGWPFRPGFRFSIKLISPLEDDLDETMPEPEAEIQAPTETFSLYLGGISLPEFKEHLEEFRLIIADMATMYINVNNIDPGLNSTSAVTQITRVAVCNIDWPDFEKCSDVTFGVPLQYEEREAPRLTEGDLRAMWYTYNGRDPFALRLRRLGLREFSVPNDSSVLTVWLVIAAGVVVSTCMLAFVLWRFSCFDNYTRMPQHSDQDSVYSEKQGLDLYPTPHQTLPPLFESEFKWDHGKMDDSTRVDMGGYTNKNFTRDELFDIESDEEVITTHDRYTSDV